MAEGHVDEVGGRQESSPSYTEGIHCISPHYICWAYRSSLQQKILSSGLEIVTRVELDHWFDRHIYFILNIPLPRFCYIYILPC